ncbi:DUF1266 domain-containing protein [Flavobacterium panacagri]|uniref:DUF1266 domain-containing protein n=1 Tax=Flavobacterium panacagri TaxID=3034146 RepID=UPI0025A4DDDC|nr:DUF1266 domain-containing protein [Flavobacterium panacagri]
MILLKLWRALSGLRLNNKEPLNGQQLDYILVSSMYAGQQSAYLNSYATGLSKREITKILQDYWGIYNIENAKETIENLMEKNNDPYTSVLYEAFENKENYVEILKSKLPDEETILDYYVQIYRAISNIIPEVTAQGLFENYSILKETKDAGWNYGRASFIARCCFEMGYLSDNEFKLYLEASYKGLKNHCKTWKEYTSSYIYGRALWGGSHNEGMISIANNLLTNNKSPLKGKNYI